MNIVDYYYALSFLVCRKWRLPNSGAKMAAFDFVFITFGLYLVIIFSRLSEYFMIPTLSHYIEDYGVRKLVYIPFLLIALVCLDRYFTKGHTNIIKQFKDMYIDISLRRCIISYVIILAPIVLLWRF